MTIYGWDASHYDQIADPARVVSEGFSFVTHKAGGDQDDPTISAWWSAFESHRDQLLLGAYWVLYPGDPTGRAQDFLDRLDSQCPGWRDGPFILQLDCERWGGNPGTQPGRDDIAQACDWLTWKMPKLMPIVYASAGQYGGSLGGLAYPLWNANYPSSMTGPASAIYQHVGGDSGPGWAGYSGQTPAIWQFTDAATIAGLTTCDANAFRGTVADLTALVAPGWSTDVELTDHVVDPSTGKDYGTLSGLLITMFNRTKALAGISAVPSADDNAQAILAALPTTLAPALAAALAPLLPSAPSITPAELQSALVAAFRQLAASAA